MSLSHFYCEAETCTLYALLKHNILIFPLTLFVPNNSNAINIVTQKKSCVGIK